MAAVLVVLVVLAVVVVVVKQVVLVCSPKMSLIINERLDSAPGSDVMSNLSRVRSMCRIDFRGIEEDYPQRSS